MRICIILIMGKINFDFILIDLWLIMLLRYREWAIYQITPPFFQ
jgi:hypothetical protein